ncbi:hypothetical protein FBY35_6899 [Streptomyces sp. SLBN-118]|uniref:hypothetical protein n=1 Tax=Streptomyces sp. SLBN-118 TaxID=2768454 RepID=UPI0011520A82|nr:hypothetical protein [Streptomyces sp. SLBN-118]TQK45338.1 hypothetical protein FBY35_6899 [Streptomyces sp. SLBN-118]
MPPTPAPSRTHASWLRLLRGSQLVRGTLYALLFMLLACFGHHRHAPETPERPAAASNEAPLSAEDHDGEILDAIEPPDRCHDLCPGQAVFPQSPARIPPPAVTALPLTDATGTPSHEPSGGVRRLLPSNGRSALTANRRWRI